MKMPESFDFGIDSRFLLNYWKPVGYFFDKLPKLYYDNRTELINDYFDYFASEDCYVDLDEGVANGFYPSLENALSTLDEEYDGVGGCGGVETPGLAIYVNFIVPNPNYGKWIDSNSTFLRYDYRDYEEKGLGYYKNPTWLLNFNFCGVNGKYEENKKFKLKGCDTYEVKWRLRVKPILLMGKNSATRPSGCLPMTIHLESMGGTDVFSSYEYSDYSKLVNLINMIETKEGSRWLGLTPMRLETGIYNYDNGKQTPIVSSQGGYPQITSNEYHTKWQKNQKDKIQCTISPFPINTKLGPNVSVNVNKTIETSPTTNDYFYYYYQGVFATSDSGFFATQSNNLNAPGVFRISKKSLKFKNDEPEGVLNFDEEYNDKLFSYMSDFISPPTEPAGLGLSLEYNINGNWVSVLRQDYTCQFINLDVSNNQIIFSVFPKSELDFFNPDYVDIPFVNGDIDFIIPTDYEYRYKFLIGFSRSIKKIDAYGSYTPQIQNYTQLSEEFTFELDGFTNVNLNDGDIGIYLKVLPDSDNSQNVGLINKDDFVNLDNFFYNSLETTDSLCDKIIGGNECYPWGELGISSKSGWVKIPNVEYFPLLPLNRNVYDDIKASSNLSDDGLAKLLYRFGLDINWSAPALYLMIEEGWVSIEPTCENC